LKLQVSDLVSSIDALLKISDAKPPEPQTYNNSDDTSSTGDPSGGGDSSHSGEQMKNAEVSEPELELEPEAVDLSMQQTAEDASRSGDSSEKKLKSPGNGASKRSRKRLSLIDMAEKTRRQQEQRAAKQPEPLEAPMPIHVDLPRLTAPTVFCVWCGAQCGAGCKFCMYCGGQTSMSFTASMSL
jgi:hypothetical protein